MCSAAALLALGAAGVGAAPQAPATKSLMEQARSLVPRGGTHREPSKVQDVPESQYFSLRNQVRCSPFDRPNARECTWVAPFAGQFCFQFSGTDTNSFAALSLAPYSGYVGPYPGTFYTNCCGATGGESCQFEDQLVTTYADTCNGNEGYSRSIASCFDLGNTQELIFTTSSNGLFRRMQKDPPAIHAAPAAASTSALMQTIHTNNAFQASVEAARAWQAAKLESRETASAIMSEEEARAVGIAIRVQCARASTPNPTECTFTASMDTLYFFVWTGDGSNAFRVVSDQAIEVAEVGPRPGVLWSGDCCAPGACRYEGAFTLEYTGSCGSANYPGISLALRLRTGQAVTVVTDSIGLM